MNHKVNNNKRNKGIDWNDANENENCLDNNNNNNKIKIITTTDKFNETQTPFIQKLKFQLRQNLILILTIMGILGGILVGSIGRLYNPSKSTIVLIGFPGEILLRILKMLILPLIISSLITGLAQLDPKSSGKMGLRAMAYYLSTTMIATVTGIVMALIVRPGKQGIHTTIAKSERKLQVTTFDAILDIIRNMFPENIVQACSQQLTTTYKPISKTKTITNLTSLALKNMSDYALMPTPAAAANATARITDELYDRELKYVDGTNVMGLVVFCTIFGIFISHSKSEAQILYDFFYVMNELIMKIVGFIMWYSPVGILFLVAANILKIDNMGETARRLSLYMITVILGLIVHAMFTMQILYILIVRKNPMVFLKGMLQAWLTAIGTASSSATLPITFRCLEENNKVDRRITRFMLPLGATINMDGTALYQSVATLFIAQLNGVEFGLGQLVAVSMASTATSIGVASVPSAALVTMLIVLSTVGLPTEHVSYIIAVDWLLDRLRTSINVLGDAYGCGIVAHLSRKELKKLDDEAENEFAQMITANEIGLIQNKVISEDSMFCANNNANVNVIANPHISICNERKLSQQKLPSSQSISQQFNEYKEFDRRPSHRSQVSINNQPQPQQQQQTNLNNAAVLKPPSLVVMDAYRRRSRAMLFGSSKIPASVISMPQISHLANPNNNDDSNV